MIHWILFLCLLSCTAAVDPRSRHTSTVVGKTLYVVGGLINNAQAADFLSLDVSQPFQVASAPFQSIQATNIPRVSHHCTAPRGSNGDLVVYGGRQPTVTSNSVYVYDASTTAWTADFTTPPTVKRYEASLAYNQGSPGSAWLFGGLADTTTVANINGTFVFNDLSEMKGGTSLFVRTTGDSGRPKARWDHQAVMLSDGRVVHVGGVVQTGDATWSLVGMDVIDVYNPSSNSWQTVTASGSVPTARRAFSAVARDNKVIVYGGTSNDFTDIYGDVAVLDMGSNSWSQPSVGNAANVQGRYSHSASMVDDKHMMVLFGTTGASNDANVYVLDTDSMQFVDSYSPYKSGLSTGAIIGIVVGCVFGFSLLVLLSIFCFNRFLKDWWAKRRERKRLQKEKADALNAVGDGFIAGGAERPGEKLQHIPPQDQQAFVQGQQPYLPDSYIPSSNISPTTPAYVGGTVVADQHDLNRWSQPSSLPFPSPPVHAADYNASPQVPNYLGVSGQDFQTPLVTPPTYGLDGVLTPYFASTPAQGTTPATQGEFLNARPDSDVSAGAVYTPPPSQPQSFSAVGGVHRRT